MKVRISRKGEEGQKPHCYFFLVPLREMVKVQATNRARSLI